MLVASSRAASATASGKFSPAHPAAAMLPPDRAPATSPPPAVTMMPSRVHVRANAAAPDGSSTTPSGASVAAPPALPPGVRTRLQKGISHPKKYTDETIRYGMLGSTGEPRNPPSALNDLTRVLLCKMSTTTATPPPPPPPDQYMWDIYIPIYLVMDVVSYALLLFILINASSIPNFICSCLYCEINHKNYA
jgi:hypothetical protein